MTILAAYPWKNNAYLIRDAVVPLGYLHQDWPTLDVTYGRGTFWKLWMPNVLEKDWPGGDFRHLPDTWTNLWKATVIDGPYKLNGRGDPNVDGRYGVEDYASPTERIRLITRGMAECWRVTEPGGYVLVKCQDQVCGGKVHWQTSTFGAWGTTLGMQLVDRFDMLRKPRPQPPRTRKDGKPSTQQHAARNSSTLLVFRKGKA